jgi:hypothetical protein
MDEHGRNAPAATGMHVDSDESGQHRWPGGAGKIPPHIAREPQGVRAAANASKTERRPAG